MNKREFIVLLFVSLPFLFAALLVTFNVWSGFFVTRVKPSVESANRFYLDKAFGVGTPIVCAVLGAVSLYMLDYILLVSPIDRLVVCTIWLCIICLHFLINSVNLLMTTTWQEYVYHPDFWNPDKPNRYRFYYPHPNIPSYEYVEEPCKRDSEMFYLYKLFQSQKYDSWSAMRREIKKKLFHAGRRCVLYRTSGEISKPKTCKSWEDYKIYGLTPDKIWKDLNSFKGEKGFPEFAQHWHFYAILVSRKSIKIISYILFSYITHIALFILAYFVYCQLSPGVEDISHWLKAILFGVAFVCSVVYSGVAVMLYVYGKVIALDDIKVPISRMGDPFFATMSRTALVLSVSTAISVGIGLPMAFHDNNHLSLLCAIFAGFFTAGIFFISIWGTHFSMENTKMTALSKVANSLRTMSDWKDIEWLKFKYTEMKKVPDWPIDPSVGFKVLVAVVLPYFWHRILDSIMSWL